MKNLVGTIGLGQVGTLPNFILKSEESMADFRMLVWKPQAKESDWPWASRQADFAQYFDRGGNLLLLLERGGEFRYILPPDFPVITQKLTGFALELVAGPLEKLIAPYFSTKLKYSVVLNVTKGTYNPIAYTQGNNQKNVALWAQYRNGFICALPFDKDRDNDLVKLIPRIDNFLSRQKKTINLELGQLPHWASKYVFLEERRAVDAKKDLEKKLAQIQSELPRLDDAIKSFSQYMYLFSETGKALDKLVRSAMAEIGFDVSDGPDLNSYAVIRYGKRVGIVISRALTGEASDKDARQVEVWKSHYESYVDLLPKGILVVNTFKDTDIMQRDEVPFSEKFTSYAEATQVCAITTTQIVGILMDIKAHPQNRDKIIQLVLESNGPLKGYNEPVKYLVTKASA